MRCGTIGSCQSAATSEIVKALLVTSLTHVSGAITSVQTFTFSLLNVSFIKRMQVLVWSASKAQYNYVKAVSSYGNGMLRYENISMRPSTDSAVANMSRSTSRNGPSG